MSLLGKGIRWRNRPDIPIPGDHGIGDLRSLPEWGVRAAVGGDAPSAAVAIDSPNLPGGVGAYGGPWRLDILCGSIAGGGTMDAPSHESRAGWRA